MGTPLWLKKLRYHLRFTQDYVSGPPEPRIGVVTVHKDFTREDESGTGTYTNGNTITAIKTPEGELYESISPDIYKKTQLNKQVRFLGVEKKKIDYIPPDYSQKQEIPGESEYTIDDLLE